MALARARGRPPGASAARSAGEFMETMGRALYTVNAIIISDGRECGWSSADGTGPMPCWRALGCPRGPWPHKRCWCWCCTVLLCAACSLALALRLHAPPPDPLPLVITPPRPILPAPTPASAAEYVRGFWMVFVLEKMWAMALGTPSQIHLSTDGGRDGGVIIRTPWLQQPDRQRSSPLHHRRSKGLRCRFLLR